MDPPFPAWPSGDGGEIRVTWFYIGWLNFPRKIAFFGPEKLVNIGKYEWISEDFPLVCYMF